MTAPAVGPLAGLAVRATGGHRALRIADRLLRLLGATEPPQPFACISARPARLAVDLLVRGPGAAGAGGVPGSRLQAAPIALPLGDPDMAPCLPAPVVDHALGLALTGAALAGLRAETVLDVDPVAVLAQVVLPLLVAPDAARPSAPTVLEDGSALCVDLGPDDVDTYPRLLDTVDHPRRDAEGLAARAQEWRLPVTPYRSGEQDEAWRETILGHRLGRWRDLPTGSSRSECIGSSGHGPLDGIRVVDLTVMWAGPLCTWLLASLGADVVKVEPACRLDGLRFGPGDSGVGDAPLFRALNGGKRRVDLDLRVTAQHEAFLALVTDADVVVDSFSPRVAGNLGIGPDRLRSVRPGLVTVSIPAFPPGPERDWVSYGPGIHAIAGLGAFSTPAEGDVPRFVAPPVAYPDPLAGLTAFVAVLAALVGRDRGWVAPHLEVPLRNSVAPLAAEGDAGRWRVLPVLEATAAARSPFSAAGLPVPLVDAPSLERVRC